MAWQLLKLFPPRFGDGLNDETVTEAQWLWLQCQLLLDQGLRLCPACEAFGLGPYCGDCGVSLAPDLAECAQCHWHGTTPYCPQCGGSLHSSVAEAIAEEMFDWGAWERSLRPFLGGLTPREQQFLADDGALLPLPQRG